MSDADRDRWEARYENDPGADRTDPDPLLAEALAHAPGSGRAIDLACGRGRHAIALAKADYEVEAVDISPRALSAARELARGLEILWQAADLDEFEMAEATYAVVCCVDFSDRALTRRMIDSLVPGGILVFSTCPRALSRFSPGPGEITRWFEGLDVLVHREDDRRIEFIGRMR